MNVPRLFAFGAVALVAASIAPTPTGSVGTGCGIAFARDSILAQQDRVQSAGAAKICAIYLNRSDAR